MCQNEETNERTLLHEIKLDRGVSWEESLEFLRVTLAEYEEVKGTLVLKDGEYSLMTKKNKKPLRHHFGYYRSKNAFGGDHFVRLVVEKVSFIQDHLFPFLYCLRPQIGRSEIQRHQLLENFIPIKEAEAKVDNVIILVSFILL